jgi:adenine-specific DNA methylase
MKATATDQKLRGGYYTPTLLTQFLTAWAIRRPEDRVLEPSSGGGAFVASAIDRLRLIGAEDFAVTAVEIDATAAGESRLAARHAPGSVVHEGDFFEWAVGAISRGEIYDAIVGNPPFIRFAYFEEQHRRIAFELMQGLGLHPNRLTNAWVPFVALSSALLAPTGRLAMVLPAELLQVSYAAELRSYLADRFNRITVFAFDRLVFDGIQQEVVLLTAERSAEGSEGIRFIELADDSELATDHHTWDNEPLKQLDHSTEKWTQYLLSSHEIEIVRALRSEVGLRPLVEFASVDVGVVTGMNDFFVLDSNGNTPAGLKTHAVPIVTRSNQLSGATLTASDWQTLHDLGRARLLLTLDNDMEPTGVVADYLASGVDRDVDKGYKCSIRRNWYVVPSTWKPSGFMLRQIHAYPKLAINETDATSTDTVHRVAFRDPRIAGQVAAAFHNVVTFLCAEVFGRSYGGGVLELEPSEAESLLIPEPRNAPPIGEVDAALRANNLDEVIRLGNLSVTRATGLTSEELTVLRTGWERLRDRRLRRNRRKAKPQQAGFWA